MVDAFDTSLFLLYLRPLFHSFLISISPATTQNAIYTQVSNVVQRCHFSQKLGKNIFKWGKILTQNDSFHFNFIFRGAMWAGGLLRIYKGLKWWLTLNTVAETSFLLN